MNTNQYRLAASYMITLLLMLFAINISTGCADERPNVVWIIADDFSPELGCYGYEGVRTPHIDQLATQGRRYQLAFATAPVCSSSRSAFITGVYQTTTGTHQHRTTHKKPLPKLMEPITELLRRSGYFVCNGNSAMNRPGKSDYNFTTSGKMFDGADWSKRKKGQPFFAQIQMHEPHRDFVKANREQHNREFEIPSYYPDHPLIRADWANYIATVEVLDAKVKVVLDRLEREGIAQNTVVMFFGDHGRPHYRDKQWLYDGGLRVPLIIRWPGSIPPSEVNHDLVSLIDVPATTLSVAGIDIPDWMDGRNLFDPSFKGRSRIFAARDRCGNTADRIRCVRTKQFKYIRNFHPSRPYSQLSGYKKLQYPGMTVARVMKNAGELRGPASLFWEDLRPTEELFDVEADPEELRNLAMDEAHGQTLEQFRHELDEWIVKSNDQGRIAEVGEEATIQSSERWYESRMKKRNLSADISPEDYLNWWNRELGFER